MIDDIGMKVTEYDAEGDNEQTVRMARLDVVVYGDDKKELQALMLRITQVINPIPHLIRYKDVTQ